MDEKTGRDDHINSIVRAIHIMNLYGALEVQELGISEISKQLDLHKTTAFRIVKTLESEGWLKKNPESGKYRLGLRILAVTSSVPRESFEELILEEMKRLGRTYNEDVVLAMLVGDMAICIEKIRSTHNLRISSRVGFTIQLDRGSTGKTLLAFQPEDTIRQYLEQQFDRTDPQQAARREQLQQELADIRRLGYCCTFSEQDEGVASMTIPLYDHRGNVIYSLGIIGAESRMLETGMDNIRESLLQTAARLREQFALLD